MTKKLPKGTIKKLQKALAEYMHDSNSKKGKEILPLINSINDVLNADESAKNDSPEKTNEQLYLDNTVKTLIQLMPFFDQPTLNSLSTLLQTTVRKYPDSSLPQYLMKNQTELTTLLSFFDQPSVSNTAHMLLRACLLSRDFTKFLFDSGFVGSFIQYLSGDNFDKLTTAFGTYDAILNTHPDISADFVKSHWQLFQIQFKQLLNSPNYLVQSTFLPILLKFLTFDETKVCFMKYLDDVQNLQLIMILLKNSSSKKRKRVPSQAYNIFKLFVINPRRSPPIVNALKKNKTQLLRFLNELKLEDSDPSLEEEKQQVISLISGF
ncbi:hypothetical protein TRFO_13655 [Tritrichomonas foetus]|uniref:Calcium-binding protein 39-like protein n=1 Tax=Tritrichomonas foetus TaxID=1144522 RepID=A0A1J4L246_9EUKA|nr:hypothetical protein TRFO_13655 [Tritrichomonas foetus]|eukprot:OHT15965.1 hypothetical protein TRFO_13655 [Tritrichomonas foetus]